MSEQVKIGSKWKRNGVTYEVQDEQVGTTRSVLLVPVDIPAGKRARRSWKYDMHVPLDMEQVEQ